MGDKEDTPIIAIDRLTGYPYGRDDSDAGVTADLESEKAAAETNGSDAEAETGDTA